jgi:HEAT repeat protein
MSTSELEEIFGTENPNRRGDVVFVHGLRGDARTTWQLKDDGFWPLWIGKDLSDVGVWSVGYPANAFAWQSTMPLADRAVDILSLLSDYDIGANRPVVFITHSLGGLLVKKMLYKAVTDNVSEEEALVKNTKGIVFLATPHAGSNLANFVKFLLPSSVSVEELQTQEPLLRELNTWYRNNYDRLGIPAKVYCESRNTNVFLVVDKTSSDPAIPGVRARFMDYDHITISKPARKSPLYKGIKKFVDDCLRPSGKDGGSKASTSGLSSEMKREAVGQFLQSIESCFNTIPLFHTTEPIILSEQYIPIQVTLERRYKHTVETAWSYAESEAELKRTYALKGGDEEIKRQQDSWKNAKRGHSRIVVLADPGMGKSTLLRMEVGTTIQESRQILDNGQPLQEIVIPLFIGLSTLANKIIEKSTEEVILDIIQEQYSNLLKHHENAEVSKFLNAFLKKQLLNNKCLLLLDALDEVSPEKRHQLLEKLSVFVQAYPCPIVGTSRIVGYGGKLVDGAKDMEIVPFSQSQTEQYIETWFTNAQKHLRDQSVSAEGLIQALRDRPQIGGLAQNPLLLSLICSLYQQDKLTLPARRCQIYEKAVEYMLGEWRQTRQPTAIRVKEAKIRLLEALAYHFTCEEQEVFKYEDIFDWVEGYLENGKAPRDLRDARTEELITELSENDGILQKLYLDRDDKQYLFLHRTFQEYFTASYLSRMIRKDSSKGIALAMQNLWKYDWHETLSLLAGMLEEPMPLIEAIIAEKDDIFQTQLLLAGRCIAECKQTDTLIPLTSEIIEKILSFWQKYPGAEFIQSVLVAIGQNHSQIHQRLQESLDDSDLDRDVRWQAIEALGQIGNAQALQTLIAVLNESDSFARCRATEALGQIGNSQAVDALITALKYPSSEVRFTAVKVLGQIANTKAVNALIDALRHSDENVRYMAANFLGRIPNAKAEDALIAILNDPDSYGDFRYTVAAVLGWIGNLQAVDVLIDALKHSDENVKITAIEDLAHVGNVKAKDALIAVLNDSDTNEDIRYRTAVVLGEIGNAQAVDVLIAALNQDDGAGYTAAMVLGKIGNSQAVDALITALKHPNRKVRYAAVTVLGRLGNAKAEDALIAVLNDSDSDEGVRYTAAAVLGQSGIVQEVDTLIAALNYSDNFVKYMAIKALGQIGNAQAADVLISELNRSGKGERWSSTEALGKIGNSEILAKILQSLEIDIYDSDIFYLTRTLAVRFSKDKKAACIPVYPELLRKAEEGDRNQEVG